VAFALYVALARAVEPVKGDAAVTSWAKYEALVPGTSTACVELSGRAECVVLSSNQLQVVRRLGVTANDEVRPPATPTLAKPMQGM
jgi:hypothetical protein